MWCFPILPRWNENGQSCFQFSSFGGKISVYVYSIYIYIYIFVHGHRSIHSISSTKKGSYLSTKYLCNMTICLMCQFVYCCWSFLSFAKECPDRADIGGVPPVEAWAKTFHTTGWGRACLLTYLLAYLLVTTGTFGGLVSFFQNSPLHHHSERHPYFFRVSL